MLISLYSTLLYSKTSVSYLPCSNAVLRLITIALWITDLNKVSKSKERNKTIAGWQSRYNFFFHKGEKGQGFPYHKSLYVFTLVEKQIMF